MSGYFKTIGDLERATYGIGSDNILKSTGATSIKDMGKVMGELKKNNADSIDFSKAGAIIKELLNQK